MDILIGTDPEVFVKKAGKLVSAFNLIVGDKAAPQPVQDGAVQVDGMALEFNTNPASTAEEFGHNVQSVLAQLAAMVPEHEIVIEPVAHFGAEYIAEQPAIARELGCDPDFNAWSGDENKKPEAETPFRTAAGHVHVGYSDGLDIDDEYNLGIMRRVARQLDFYLGLPSLLFDSDVERRSMYGQAGAFRPKPYGLEYRTLSNAWLKSDEAIAWVFNASNKAVRDLLEGVDLEEKYGDIQDIINNSDVEAAKAIIEAEGLEVPNV